MIDWLTLRHPMTGLNPALYERLKSSMLYLSCVTQDGELRWEKQTLDIDSLRSDSPGLYWQIQGNGKQNYIAIGGSPAHLEHGNNVFGSGDIRHCAEVMVRHARKALGAVLPDAKHWQPRRLDKTFNYALPGFSECKQALRQLKGTDASRARGSSMGGDTWGWNVGSDLQKGKAYHKGPQLRRLVKKGLAEVTEQQLDLADRMIRLELTLGSRWWRRFEQNSIYGWWDITEQELSDTHNAYFVRFFGAEKVVDMGQLLIELEKVAPTPGQALAAHRTWALIKAVGYENTRESMPKATFCRHLKALRAAGVSDADLCAGQILPFRSHTIYLNQPVMSWSDMLRAA